MLVDGEPVGLPLTAQRVVAFLALQQRPLQRSYVAAKLWLETSEERAAGSLRSAVWRVHRSETPLVRTLDTRLVLDPGVRVDLAEALATARLLLLSDESEVELGTVDLTALKGEILPDWYDDWLMMERETVPAAAAARAGGDGGAARLTAVRRFGEAIEAAMAAIAGRAAARECPPHAVPRLPWRAT